MLLYLMGVKGRQMGVGVMPKATAAQHTETAYTRDHLMLLSELQNFMNFVSSRLDLVVNIDTQSNQNLFV